MYMTIDELRKCQLDELVDQTNLDRTDRGLDELDEDGVKELHRGTSFTNDDFSCTAGKTDEELDLEDARNGDFSRFEEGKCKLPFRNRVDAEEETQWWTIDEVLEEINRDRSEQWTDYDKSDWMEGLREWTEYELAI